MKVFEGYEKGINLGGWLLQKMTLRKLHPGDLTMYGFRLTML